MKAAAAGILTPQTDPVCGMLVDEGKAEASGRTGSYHGQTYYFCSDNCKRRFEASPAKYVPEAPPSSSATAREPAPPPGAVHRGNRDGGAREAGSLPRTPEPDAPPADPGAAEAAPIETSARTEADLEPGTSADPACGDIVEIEWATASGLKLEYKGRTYYFVSKECKDQFEGQPEQYAGEEVAGTPAAVGPPSATTKTPAASTQVRDPVCGMEIDETEARAAGRTSEHGGRTYAFCSELCKERFDKDPARYAAMP